MSQDISYIWYIQKNRSVQGITVLKEFIYPNMYWSA